MRIITKNGKVILRFLKNKKNSRIELKIKWHYNS